MTLDVFSYTLGSVVTLAVCVVTLWYRGWSQDR